MTYRATMAPKQRVTTPCIIAAWKIHFFFNSYNKKQSKLANYQVNSTAGGSSWKSLGVLRRSGNSCGGTSHSVRTLNADWTAEGGSSELRLLCQAAFKSTNLELRVDGQLYRRFHIRKINITHSLLIYLACTDLLVNIIFGVCDWPTKDEPSELFIFTTS